MKDKIYTVIQAHYGSDHSFWRVVSNEKDKELQTVGKFPTKEKAEEYVTYLRQATDRSHNQW